MKPLDGYDIIINSQQRTFRDRKEVAYDAAAFAKAKCPQDEVQIIEQVTGTIVTMLPDGRTK